MYKNVVIRSVILPFVEAYKTVLLIDLIPLNRNAPEDSCRAKRKQTKHGNK